MLDYNYFLINAHYQLLKVFIIILSKNNLLRMYAKELNKLNLSKFVYWQELECQKTAGFLLLEEKMDYIITR